jgi:FADH2 O2-dependent halogenase
VAHIEREVPSRARGGDVASLRTLGKEGQSGMTAKRRIVIVGSGIAGSTLALTLSRVGVQVIVIEKKSHPRFAIGESSLPTTALLLRFLSDTYDVPELRKLTTYPGLKEAGLTGWAKASFYFTHHKEGQKDSTPGHEMMFDTFVLPNGPDVHYLRADLDGYLVSLFPKYGVEYQDQTEVLDFESSEQGVKLNIKGPSGQTRTLEADFLVDASGHDSLFANRCGLRQEPPNLRTDTRSIFSHWSNLPDIEESLPGNPNFRFRRDAATMHHVFDGGWIWAIPFDNQTTSIGFVLNRKKFPEVKGVTPEQELESLFERFPSIGRLVRGIKPVRPIVSTGRIQFRARSILAPGLVLTPHASGFIDPLFSTGFLLTFSFIARFTKIVQLGMDDRQAFIERLQGLEKAFMVEIDHLDRLVGCMQDSFTHFEVFKQTWLTWIVSTNIQVLRMAFFPHENHIPFIHGSGARGFTEDVEKIWSLVRGPISDERATASQVRAIIAPWMERFITQVAVCGSTDVGAGSVGMWGEPWPTKFDVSVRNVVDAYDLKNATWDSAAYLQQRRAEFGVLLQNYAQSKRDGTTYARAIDFIRAQRSKVGPFDYFEKMFADVMK